MTKKVITALLTCVVAMGVAGLAGCNKEEKSNDASKLAPLLLLNQQESYFPQIPKGVAR